MEHSSEDYLWITEMAYRLREEQPLSENEKARLDAWLLASPENRQLMESLSSRAYLSLQLRQLANFDTQQATDNIYRSLQLHQPKRLKLPVKWMAAAAVVLVASATLFLWNVKRSAPIVAISSSTDSIILPGSLQKAQLILGNGNTITLDTAHNGLIAQEGGASVHKVAGTIDYTSGPENKVTTNKLVTPKGGQYQVRLPDGSRVWLNSASSLEFPTEFTAGERTVTLNGEAYFEITPNAERPFRVITKDASITVLGTNFNLNAYEEEAQVTATLLQGSIQMEAGNKELLMKPGQQCGLNRIQGTLMLTGVDVQKAIAWKNGMFEFNNADLPTILREISRWYDVEIIYQTNQYTVRLGGGISRNQPLSKVLSLLEASGSNRFRTEGRKIYVLPAN